MDTQKVAIITGASRGLGELVAKKLKELDWKLGLCARKRIVVEGGNVIARIVDVSLEYEVRHFVDEIYKTYGRIDVLVNDAGFCHALSELEHITPQVFQRSFFVNTLGPYYFMKEVIPIMKQQGRGVIINVASRSGLKANPMLPAYSASKAALISLTEAVALELPYTGVCCTYVAPGPMNTEMRREVAGDANEQDSPEKMANEIINIINGELK